MILWEYYSNVNINYFSQPRLTPLHTLCHNVMATLPSVVGENHLIGQLLDQDNFSQKKLYN